MYTIEEHVSGDELLELALKILGESNSYEDDVISIFRQFDHVEVTRKPMPEIADWLAVENPVTMAENRRVYRHHGEHSYITKHMRDLCS